MRPLTLISFSMVLAGLPSAVLAADLARLPSVATADLNKRKVELPGGLEGELNLLLVAFQREQQNDIDTWLPAMPALVQRYPKLAYYELPVISRSNFMMRWVINSGMRGGIPDKKQRGRTLTLYLDKKPFLDSLQISTEDRIYALLVNKAGEVLWRSEGMASAEKQGSLEAYLHSH